jgi:hypothetical protein
MVRVELKHLRMDEGSQKIPGWTNSDGEKKENPSNCTNFIWLGDVSPLSLEAFMTRTVFEGLNQEMDANETKA